MGSTLIIPFVRRLVATTTVALALASALGLFGHLSWVVDLFAHFRVQFGLGLLVCLVASLRLRQPRISLLAASFLLLNFLIVSPQLVYQSTADARGERTIRLLHANVNYYNRDFESALDFFLETDPDVLLIVEANETWMSALAPMKERLSYTMLVQRGKPGIAVMSRYPIVVQGRYFSPRNPSIVAHIEFPDSTLRIVGTHAGSPASSSHSRRRDHHLASIATFVRHAPEPTVLLGDLNTTPWGHAFRALVRDSGLRDSSRGFGFQWSWPASFWPLGIPIDHALVSDDIRVLDRRMGPDIGSDHLPLVVDIALSSHGEVARLPQD